MKRRRLGISLIEVTVAIVVLASATLVLTQLLAGVASQRRIATQQQLATDTAASTLELALAAPYNATAPAARDVELSAEVQAFLKQATCQLRTIPMAASESSPAGQRLVVTVHWQAGAGGQPQRVELNGWKFTHEETAP